MEASDRELLKMCRKNKREGYELLIKKYQNYIYKICFYYTASKEDALDLIQEIFLKICKALNGFDHKKPLLPWIKKITVNTCINFVKQNKNNPVSLNTPINDGDEETFLNTLSSSENTENNVICNDTKKLIEESIRELPDEMRIAVILRHVKGMSYSEIGELMSCPLGTVKTHLYRGRALLKNILKSKGVWEL